MISYAFAFRRRLCELDRRQGECAETVHERKAEDQRRRDEGDTDGAGAEEGADWSEAVRCSDGTRCSMVLDETNGMCNCFISEALAF